MAIPPIQAPGRIAPLSHPQQQTARTQERVEAQISSGNEPLSLLYRSAVAKLNELLEPELGPDALQQAQAGQIDFSPEAVAQRIVSFATAFFPDYRDNHPDSAEDEQLGGFLGLIRDAIDQGFREAREILEGLGVLQGGISDDIDRTYELIQQGLDAFEQDRRDALSDQTGAQ